VGLNYILISCCLILLVPVFSFYLSLIIELKRPSDGCLLDWVIIFIESFLPFLIMTAAWIHSFRLATLGKERIETEDEKKEPDIVN
jgi:hypothetical protein